MTFTIICSNPYVKAITGTTQVFKVRVLNALLLVRVSFNSPFAGRIGPLRSELFVTENVSILLSV